MHFLLDRSRARFGLAFLALALALVGSLLASCSNDDDTGFCPTDAPRGPALDPATPYLLVADGLGEDWLAAPLGRAEVTPLETRGLTGPVPNDMNVVDGRLYIVNSGDNTVSVVDLSTGCTLGTIDVGTGTNPWEFFPDPSDNGRAWVTTLLTGEVVELDLAALKVVRRKAVGTGAEGLFVTADRVAVTLSGYDGQSQSFGPGTVVVLDKTDLSEVARLAVPPNAQFLLPGADGRMHVVCSGNYADVFGQVVRIETDWSSVRDTLNLGGSPGRAVVASDGTAYLASFFGGILSYDTASFQVLHDVSAPVLGDSGFTDLAVYAGRLFAANFSEDKVVIVNLADGTKAGEFLAGDGPAAVEVAAP